MRLLSLALILTAVSPSNLFAVQAQTASASIAPGVTALAHGNGPTVPVVPVEVPATTVVVGRIRTAAGPLPGAIIKITGTNEMAVTDADGSFHVTVPAGSGPLKATASYAGFVDEPVTLNGTDDEVTMKTSRFIVVSKGQSLKTYRKTARKQIKRSVRTVRKANK